ncbi:MAG: Coenzyme F420 hydrogenase/dehydrogenase, beta subunit C-terminal domain [Candidatus Aminicenantes bacterium]|nr:Coenzyme F420 hydrogenase/dehydrogenase, beta subunit C-terminal domain [Candidatus Aminicenantes bacterium]
MSQVYGADELLRDVLQKDICSGCGGCVDLCPYLKNYRGKTIMVFPCTLAEGRCYAHCPMAEVDLDELSKKMWNKPYEGRPLGTYLKILSSKAGKKMPSRSYQAGGTVSSLMTFALKEGIIDAAVLTDKEGWIPIPRLVTQPEDVFKCAGSKFSASPTLAALNLGAKKGYCRMGVVGTPCQGLSIAQMRGNLLNEKEFHDPVEFVIGLFCTWAVDTREFTSLLSAYVGTQRITGMDIPAPPSNIMVVHTAETRIEIPLDRLRPLIPASCRICPDMTSEWTDVSVGILEGRPEWNTLIIRTERGHRIVNAAGQAGYLETGEMPKESLQHLCESAAHKKRQAVYRAKKEGLLNTASRGRHSVFRMPEKVARRILAQKAEEICLS